MARKKNKKQNKKQNSKPNNSAVKQKQQESPLSKAKEFLTNLGPEGYIRKADSLSKDIFIEKYSMSTPDGATVLLDNTSLKINSGRKYALIGKNGYGKTTLLNNMASYNIEGFPTHVRMVHVHQECDNDDKRTVKEAVLEADIVRTQLIAEAERLEEEMYEQEDETKAEEMQNDLDTITAYMDDIKLQDSHSRAFRILAGLGFDKTAQNDKVDSLSGGWRMRLEIAKALFVEPDLLLLDEPTNHLDFPAVLWLQQHLTTEYSKTLVVVSHDKFFIDAVADRVIHLDNETKKLCYFKGNYTAFEKARAEQLKTLQNARRAQLVQIDSLKEFITKFRDKGEKRAAQVQSKLKTLRKLEAELPEIPRGEKKAILAFPEPEAIEEHLVLFKDVSFSYLPDKPLLDKVNLAVDIDSRVGIIGANGVGKSTLIKLVLGKLKPDEGEIERAERLRVAYFSQHHYDMLRLDESAVEFFLREFEEEHKGKKDLVQSVRRYLGRFGIRGDRQNQKIAVLSGGQKSRVLFAAMTYRTPHLLVMDEPTNHLDLETIETLLESLEEFKGGILAISHDTHFLSKFAKDFWSLTPQRIVRFDNFDDAKKHALEKRIGELN